MSISLKIGETNLYLKKFIYTVVAILLITSVITQNDAHRHKTRRKILLTNVMRWLDNG